MKLVFRETPNSEKTELAVRQSRKFGKEMDPRAKLALDAWTPTSRSGSGKGSGLSSTPLTSEKSAVLAPTPRAMVSTATAVKPGALRRPRSACLRSSRKLTAGRSLQLPFPGRLRSNRSLPGTRHPGVRRTAFSPGTTIPTIARVPHPGSRRAGLGG